MFDTWHIRTSLELEYARRIMTRSFPPSYTVLQLTKDTLASFRLSSRPPQYNFKAPGSLSAGVFGTSYSTPTLHVIGKTDIIVVEERSKILLDLSQNKTLEEHGGGQLVPLCIVTCF